MVSSAALAKNEGFPKWREWISAQQGYLDKIEAIMAKGKDVAIRQNADLQDAMKKDDRLRGEKIIDDATKKLARINDELKAIIPPGEFKEYHTKVLEAYKFRQMANEAAQAKDVLNIRNNNYSAITSEIGAMESIRALYISHDAPKQIIASIDKSIAAYKQRLVAK